MIKWFRSALPPYQTALAMLGIKSGQRVICLGAADPGLAAEAARITGLNGRTVVAELEEAARSRIEHAAAQVGALVELAGRTEGTEPPDAYDLVAITTAWSALQPGARRARVIEAFRLVRPGGRVVLVVSAGAKPRFGGARPVPREILDEALALFSAAGSRAARVLGEAAGTAYVEGVKPQRPQGA